MRGPFKWVALSVYYIPLGDQIWKKSNGFFGSMCPNIVAHHVHYLRHGRFYYYLVFSKSVVSPIVVLFSIGTSGCGPSAHLWTRFFSVRFTKSFGTTFMNTKPFHVCLHVMRARKISMHAHSVVDRYWWWWRNNDEQMTCSVLGWWSIHLDLWSLAALVLILCTTRITMTVFLIVECSMVWQIN